MIPIRGPTDVSHISDPHLQRLIHERLIQLSAAEPYDPQAHGELYVAEEGDTAETLEMATGVFIITNPFDGLRFGQPDFTHTCEFIEEHPACFELGFVMSDESAVAIIVPKHKSIDPELTAFCTAFAVPSID